MMVVIFMAACLVWAENNMALKGEIAPQVMISKNGNFIRLPYRLLTLEATTSRNAVSGALRFDCEHAPLTNDINFDIREAYAAWNHSLGELHVGKEIVAWGSADANNPTDNVNPFNYYYLMKEGVNRKVGKLMVREDLFYKDITFSLVVSPYFSPAIVPFDDPDMPIFSRPVSVAYPIKVPLAGIDTIVNIALNNLVVDPKNSVRNSEVGARARASFSAGEVSASFFEGFDRMYSPVLGLLALTIPPLPSSIILPAQKYYTFHRTQVYGLEGVGLYQDWALRLEGAYFRTKDLDGVDPVIRNPYVQYVAQADWNAPARTSLIIQYLGMHSLKVDSTAEEEAENRLPVGMGALFCGFAHSGIMAVARKEIGDAPHTIEARGLYDFDKGGYMAGGAISFSLAEAFFIKLSINYFNGDAGSIFHNMTDFSHLIIQGIYNF
ncbi:MAG: hypothetical protein A2268_10025 [Candidatus Raymondbacteria bacterium RifOxyA12_full_50_37]|nr:MAG: hypothetical protein A2268_10025 [Candidatus Raymondbacteria bacterium RifOxyA12_full_50_37]OGJ93825.1 MAG: hypothetical protein A2248_06275 [Candidatus Raymondbacteria bacterium RIFOXYA2_FULL_49_16]OGJ98308.1 MAG: hypothetical protein A2453_00900 [Candidatus Raymondbacteria bacterium RIFOXYC2_FULL_50_21]OGK04086.1 MAG: hypothetical protein A2350_05100 [Candidatus Raymondbacteria bacterium RifOxyB12_full_50_8]OGK05639.1 MAG: hypothetical protein A2487_18445 [Candidatus Raymondbacteria b